jgi:hypothetical protein
MLFGVMWSFYPLAKEYFPNIHDPVNYPYLFVPLDEIMKTIDQKRYYTRIILDLSPGFTLNQAGFLVTIPVTGIYFFLFFGIGKEARKMYQDRLRSIIRLFQLGKRTSNDQDTNDPKHPTMVFLSSSWRGLPLFNRNPMPVITPLELPVAVTYPPEMGSKSSPAIVKPYQIPQPDSPHRKGSPSIQGYPISPPSPADAVENAEQEPYIVILQAPPPAYAPVPPPSKHRR